MDEGVEYSSASMHREETRKEVRYSVSALVEFQWLANCEQWHDAIGAARDIGEAGLFIESESIRPVAYVLGLIVTLPSEAMADVVLRLGWCWGRSDCAAEVLDEAGIWKVGGIPHAGTHNQSTANERIISWDA
jgi:hypothetical protein